MTKFNQVSMKALYCFSSQSWIISEHVETSSSMPHLNVKHESIMFSHIFHNGAESAERIGDLLVLQYTQSYCVNAPARA